MSLPRIGVTLGDPGGIGPEIVVKALLRWPELPAARFVLFGTSELLRREEKALGVSLGAVPFEADGSGEEPRFSLVEVPVGPLSDVRAADAKNGQASFAFFQAALEAAQTGRVQAIVTAPISKLSWSLGGIPYHGHTEFLETIYPGAIMSFWSEKLVVALFSTICPSRTPFSAWIRMLSSGSSPPCARGWKRRARAATITSWPGSTPTPARTASSAGKRSRRSPRRWRKPGRRARTFPGPTRPTSSSGWPTAGRGGS